MHKMMNNQAPQYLCYKFRKRKNVKTRQKHDLEILLFKTKSTVVKGKSNNKVLDKLENQTEDCII